MSVAHFFETVGYRVSIGPLFMDGAHTSDIWRWLHVDLSVFWGLGVLLAVFSIFLIGVVIQFVVLFGLQDFQGFIGIVVW